MHWLLVLDDCTDNGFSFFLKEKSQTSEVMIPFLKLLERHFGKGVKYIRCDNSGENKALQKECEKAGLGISFEYTAPGTPQQNGRVERKFATFWGRMRAMMAGGDFSLRMKQLLWCEAANTTTDFDNFYATEGSSLGSATKFWGKGYKSLIDSPKNFGEACIVTDTTKIKAKLSDRGKVCMWMGYARDHKAGTYRLYNPTTRKIIMSRDVIFLRKSTKEYEAERLENHRRTFKRQFSSKSEVDESNDDDTPPNLVSKDDTDDEGEREDLNQETQVHFPPVVNIVPDDDTISARVSSGLPGVLQTNSNLLDPKVYRALRQLEGPFINPGATDLLNRAKATGTHDVAEDSQASHTSKNPNTPSESQTGHTPESGREHDAGTTVTNADIAYFLLDVCNAAWPGEEKLDNEEPECFQDAWNHSDPVQCKKWRAAIRKEFHDMIKRKVWRVIRKRDIPPDRRCVKSKWVFKVKRNGVYRARLVACGYSQVPGVDFSENYSPVVNDITLRLLLIAKMVYGLQTKIIDVETAFLYGDLEEEIFMECPRGLEGVTDEDALQLYQCIYGLVQAARQYYKKFIKILKSIGFVGGDVDPCLLMQNNEKGLIYVAVYVDDNFLIGTNEAIEDTIASLRAKGLVLKETDNLDDYLSCQILFSNDGQSAWLGQPHLISKLQKKFGDQVSGKRSYKTPGTPGFHCIRNTDPDLALSKELHKDYCSGVGMLLYLVKYSRPDIANCVRELSKVLDSATGEAYNEMLRVIKFVLDTHDLGLRMILTEGRDLPWVLVLYCDSDYAGDPDSRKSVSGYILFVRGVPVAWRSKAQRSVTLSSSEAEWISLSEAVKEIMFVLQLLGAMKIKVQLPVTVLVDNVGAIFMSSNVTTSSRTKHVDIRTKYVRQYVEDGIVKIVFVRSESNRSDIMTKNVQGDLFDKHASHLVVPKHSQR